MGGLRDFLQGVTQTAPTGAGIYKTIKDVKAQDRTLDMTALKDSLAQQNTERTAALAQDSQNLDREKSIIPISRAIPIMKAAGIPTHNMKFDGIDSMTQNELNQVIGAWNSKNSSMGGVTTGSVTWDKATPEQQRLAIAYANGNISSTSLGMRDKAVIVTLANEYANQKGQAFQSYGGDVKEGMSKNLAYGKMGQNVLSYNTALGHADEAMKAFDALGNTDVQLLNKPINWLKKNTNDPKVVNLGVTLDALRGELSNVFKSSGGTDVEIAKWADTLNENLTPEQARSVMPQVIKLLRSRTGAVEYQQKNVMTQAPSERTLVSPKSEEIMQHLENQQGASPPGQVPGGQQPTGKVRVTNGQETLEIDAADAAGLAEAMQEGFRRL